MSRHDEIANRAWNQPHKKYRYYDEGIAAREAGEPFDESATLDWKDGWRDTDEEMFAAQQESKAATAGDNNQVERAP